MYRIYIQQNISPGYCESIHYRALVFTPLYANRYNTVLMDMYLSEKFSQALQFISCEIQ